MPSLSATVTLSADATTFGGIQEFLRQTQELSIDPATELLDGSHTRIEGYDPSIQEVCTSAGHATLSDLAIWVDGALGQGAEATNSVLVGGDTLAVDLAVLGVATVACGDCIPPQDQPDILVDLHTHSRAQGYA